MTDIDKQVAEQVMGWTNVGRHDYKKENCGCGKNHIEFVDYRLPPKEKFHYRRKTIPKYSTNISDAWLVVEKMRELNYTITIKSYRDDWCCCFAMMQNDYYGYNELLTLAICKAALQATK